MSTTCMWSHSNLQHALKRPNRHDTFDREVADRAVESTPSSHQSSSSSSRFWTRYNARATAGAYWGFLDLVLEYLGTLLQQWPGVQNVAVTTAILVTLQHHGGVKQPAMPNNIPPGYSDSWEDSFTMYYKTWIVINANLHIPIVILYFSIDYQWNKQ